MFSFLDDKQVYSAIFSLEIFILREMQFGAVEMCLRDVFGYKFHVVNYIH